MAIGKNILVTGGCGFIGSHFIDTIIHNKEVERVVNVDFMTYASNYRNHLDHLENPKYHHCIYNIVFEDIYHVIKTHNIDTIVHFAAESHVDNSISNPTIFAETNVIGTLNLLNNFKEWWEENNKNNGFRFIHISTDEVYGSLEENNNPSTENDVYKPNSPYSASKASSDHFVRSYYETYGLPTIITHSSNNYGPRQFPEKLIPVIVKKARNKEPIPIYGDGLQIRDWIYVTDNVEAVYQVMRKGRIGEVYNIGYEEGVTNIEMAQAITEILNMLIPDDEIDYKTLITHVEDRLGHDRRYALDTQKIRTELNWSPRFHKKEGLEQTIRWYIDNPEYFDLH